MTKSTESNWAEFHKNIQCPNLRPDQKDPVFGPLDLGEKDKCLIGRGNWAPSSLSSGMSESVSQSDPE